MRSKALNWLLMSKESFDIIYCSDSDKDISISQEYLEKKKQEIDRAFNALTDLGEDLDVKLNLVLKRQE